MSETPEEPINETKVPTINLKSLMPNEQTVVILQPDAETFKEEIQQRLKDGKEIVVEKTFRLKKERCEGKYYHYLYIIFMLFM